MFSLIAIDIHPNLYNSLFWIDDMATRILGGGERKTTWHPRWPKIIGQLLVHSILFLQMETPKLTPPIRSSPLLYSVFEFPKLFPPTRFYSFYTQLYLTHSIHYTKP